MKIKIKYFFHFFINKKKYKFLFLKKIKYNNKHIIKKINY